ncbi:hypothetical protein HC928_22305 [bacterium]|nr:hypothetical protein [bacterium]
MLAEEKLAEEFKLAVERCYPRVGTLLHQCHVRVIVTSWGQPARELEYLGIYCPSNLIKTMRSEKDILRGMALMFGLTEVIYLNATALVRDPKSSLKQDDPKLWLELCWVATSR